jgi:hypothetical protein
MTPNTDALTPEEFASLRELAKGMLATQVPAAHTAIFLRFGWVTQRLLEYSLTDEGTKRLRRGQP